jgi:hypothetical protein
MADDQGRPSRASRRAAQGAPPPTAQAGNQLFERERLKWATSRSVEKVSEISVMAPIKIGRIPGERRTYEERLRLVIASLAARAEKRIPNELDRIPTIHFGRIFIIRPEQYLLYSDVRGVTYCPPPNTSTSEPSTVKIPDQIDAYRSLGISSKGEVGGPANDPTFGSIGIPQKKEDAPELRSWLFTLVEFDGDLRVYMRDIAVFLNEAFDSVFENCDDFPGTADFEKFWLWLRRYQFPTDLFYARYPNLTVTRIKQLEEFKRRFDAFVAKVRPASGPPVGSMDELFDQFLRETRQHHGNFPTPGGSYLPQDREE